MPTQQQVVDAILEGIEDAQKMYKEWSGDRIDWTAEHVISGFIAKSIMDMQGPKVLYIEPRAREVAKSASPTRRGKIAKAIREGGHVDMCFCWANYDIRAVIEIKHNVESYDRWCKIDIKRILAYLSMPLTKCKFGIFAFYSSVDKQKCPEAQRKLEERLSAIESQIKKDCINEFEVVLHQRPHDDNDVAWVASCIVIKKRVV